MNLQKYMRENKCRCTKERLPVMRREDWKNRTNRWSKFSVPQKWLHELKHVYQQTLDVRPTLLTIPSKHLWHKTSMTNQLKPSIAGESTKPALSNCNNRKLKKRTKRICVLIYRYNPRSSLQIYFVKAATSYWLCIHLFAPNKTFD